MDTFSPKPILNKSEVRNLKRKKTRFKGKKVITDDVKKLKSLKVAPDIPEEEKIHYYKEPIWIEYYIPKESRFALETKFLFIKLIDELPRSSDVLMKDALNQDELMDIYNIYNQNPELYAIIKNSYFKTFSLLELISFHYQDYQDTGNANHLKTPLYLTETLIKQEPTIATLELLGEFTLYNLNWLIRKLNVGKIEFFLEDLTVSLLIKRRNDYWLENNLINDEDYEVLEALFYDQAFPHRGAIELEEMDFLLE